MCVYALAYKPEFLDVKYWCVVIKVNKDVSK